MTAAQESEQQDTERIDIGRRRDGTAMQLLGRGEDRRTRLADAAHQRRRRCRVIAFQQHGHAKVEEFDVAGRCHQDIRGLDVAMHDLVGVRICHGGQQVQEQAKARLDSEGAFVAMLIDVPAVNEFEHQVGLAGR